MRRSSEVRNPGNAAAGKVLVGIAVEDKGNDGIGRRAGFWNIANINKERRHFRDALIGVDKGAILFSMWVKTDWIHQASCLFFQAPVKEIGQKTDAFESALERSSILPEK